jgi:hypothetical protein
MRLFNQTRSSYNASKSTFVAFLGRFPWRGDVKYVLARSWVLKKENASEDVQLVAISR